MLRDKLVETALEWQKRFGVAPQITSVVSEYDSAMLVGMSEKDYSDFMQDKTAVQKGFDFIFKGLSLIANIFAIPERVSSLS